ncbi:MAG: hypothetical protein Q9228_003204 [Teloschistes exilis]
MDPSSASLPAKNAVEETLHSSKLIDSNKIPGVEKTFDDSETPHSAEKSSGNSEDHTFEQASCSVRNVEHQRQPESRPSRDSDQDRDGGDILGYQGYLPPGQLLGEDTAPSSEWTHDWTQEFPPTDPELLQEYFFSRQPETEASNYDDHAGLKAHTLLSQEHSPEMSLDTEATVNLWQTVGGHRLEIFNRKVHLKGHINIVDASVSLEQSSQATSVADIPSKVSNTVVLASLTPETWDTKETDTIEAMPEGSFHPLTFEYVAWFLSSRHNAQISINSNPLDDSKYKDKEVEFRGEQVRHEYGKQIPRAEKLTRSVQEDFLDKTRFCEWRAEILQKGEWFW